MRVIIFVLMLYGEVDDEDGDYNQYPVLFKRAGFIRKRDNTSV